MRIVDLKVGTRLGLRFALLLALLASVAGLGISSMKQSDETIDRITDVNVKKIALLQDMSQAVHVVSRVMRTIALLNDEAQASARFQKIVAAREKYDAASAELEKMPLDEVDKSAIARIEELKKAARPLND